MWTARLVGNATYLLFAKSFFAKISQMEFPFDHLSPNKVLLFAKSPNAYSFFADKKCYFFAKWFRTTVRADARMAPVGGISVFLIPGMVTMGSELVPAGPNNKNQHLAV